MLCFGSAWRVRASPWRMDNTTQPPHPARRTGRCCGTSGIAPCRTPHLLHTHRHIVTMSSSAATAGRRDAAPAFRCASPLERQHFGRVVGSPPSPAIRSPRVLPHRRSVWENPRQGFRFSTRSRFCDGRHRRKSSSFSSSLPSPRPHCPRVGPPSVVRRVGGTAPSSRPHPHHVTPSRTP